MNARMSGKLFARPLGAERAHAAFPLVRIAVPELTLERWRRFLAEGRTPSNGDMPLPRAMVVEDGRGYIHGLCTCSLEHDLRSGASLLAENFVVLDLVDSRPAASVLLHALEAEAARQGCHALHVSLPAGPADEGARTGLIRHLGDAGLAVQSLGMVKPVGRAER